MKHLFILFLLVATTAVSCDPYKGSPWQHNPQPIPGRVQCEFYDIGGEGISYHDTDSVNNGSGRLNPANGSFYNEFRMDEGVDVSYTKSGGTDDNPFNVIMPEMNQLYIGWTEPGEWVNYTVNVKKAGKYQIGLMFTSNRGGEIEVVSDRNASTGPMKIPTTFNESDTLGWRQWHHWNKAGNLGTLELRQGKQVITLKTLSEGNMNYDYLEFTPED